MVPVWRPHKATSCALLTLLLVGCSSDPAYNVALNSYPAGVHGSTSVSYYDVQGSTLREVIADVRRLGPTSGGHAYWGSTHAAPHWDWRYRTEGAFCVAAAVTATVQSDVILPRWTPPQGTAPAVIAQWNDMMANLEIHENGHKEIGARAALDGLRALQHLKSSCNGFNSDAHSLIDDIGVRMRAEQLDYDARTHHGATQGATLRAP